MELKEALLCRRSVRNFLKTPVPCDIVNIILHSAMSGPSACNKQPWEFYVVTNEEKLDALKSIKNSSRSMKFEAPLAIVVCGNLSRALPEGLSEYWVQDCSAATENILLSVTDLGLGAVWCGAYPQEAVANAIRECLDIPKEQVPLNIIYIGYPAELPEPCDRYDENKLHFIK